MFMRRLMQAELFISQMKGVRRQQGIIILTVFFSFIFLFITTSLVAQETFTPGDLLSLKEADEAKISPDGKWIAYVVEVPREPDDKPGSAYEELYVYSTKTKEVQPFITGKTDVSDIAWHPDSKSIAFRSKREENKKTQVWMIPIGGGEARQITDSPSSVLAFNWHPNGDKIAYVAETPKTKREKTLKEKGYDFIYFEENLKHRNLYLIDVKEGGSIAEPTPLTEGQTVWTFTFSPDGQKIAASISPKNLIDHKYMFRTVHLIDLQDKSVTQLTHNEGKIGNFVFSPDGAHLAYAASLERKDHNVSQAYVIPVKGGKSKNLTIDDFRGHVSWVNWKDNKTIVYRAAEETATTLNTINLDTKSGRERKVFLSSEKVGMVFEEPSGTDGFKQMALIGESPQHPEEVYYWNDGKLQKITNLNPKLKNKKLGKQEVASYKARDGMEIEGILIYPVGYEEEQTYPMVVFVHGGPESHYSNGWVSSYSRPGQVLSNRGYLVFYPNYRASTGYGVTFALAGYGDPAGTEFDDIADGIDHFVEAGMADENRVGLAGGSYGGYAAAWFSSYYTEKVKAVGMFVGIGDLVSKRSSTDIPYELLYVHFGKKLEDMWDMSLKRSPVYYAHQSQTAVLIYGGTEDERVNPAQSLEYFRRLQMNDHPAVRLVRYPGEKHGNREQPGRIDVCYRLTDWFDWYVKDGKPIDGPMPPLDISDKYGLKDLPSKGKVIGKLEE